jgi:hypothetical protein
MGWHQSTNPPGDTGVRMFNVLGFALDGFRAPSTHAIHLSEREGGAPIHLPLRDV